MIEKGRQSFAITNSICFLTKVLNRPLLNPIPHMSNLDIQAEFVDRRQSDNQGFV
ncbi:hypothetical protein D9M68_692200 [compost metagenome]